MTHQIWICHHCKGTGKEIIEIHEEALCEAAGREWWQPYIRRVQVNCYECSGTGYVRTKESAA